MGRLNFALFAFNPGAGEKYPDLGEAVHPWGENLPTVNALLNATTVVFLLLGYVAIRRRLVRLHITCMVSGLLFSTAFLTSYLYYHIVIKGGHSTPFTAQGLVRPVYYTILVTHIVLATIVVPLALYTARLGWLERRARHVRLARWTLPLWLYVSVTGVVVYLMLYHLYPNP